MANGSRTGSSRKQRLRLHRGVHWKHLGVVNLPTGKPTLALTGGAAERLATMVPEGHEAVIHLTITDDHPWAEAQVIIEALPVQKP